jgi:hypothetical protein
MAPPRRWPGYTEYRDAIQTPRVCFANTRLRAARIHTDALGIPLAATGKSAIVFRATVGSSDVALRCFTREASEQRPRYQQLHSYLAHSRPRYLVDFTYRDREILVAGNPYPVVEMGWAQGVPLHMWGQGAHRAQRRPRETSRNVV